MERKEFIRQSFAGGLALLFPYCPDDWESSPFIMTVNGQLAAKQAGIILPHEHFATDFTGAEKVVQPQYDPSEAANIMLAPLLKLKERGVSLMAECTPNYIGRDVRLLKLLSDKTGIGIVTNTGYYAAVGQKYLPQHAFIETAEQLSARFLKEWETGIDGTGIRPGFIKLGVDNGPLKEIEKKLIRAAAFTHLQSGLKIAIHTGDEAAANEEYAILAEAGVAPEAFIWVHAQNDKVGDSQIELAKKGCWISLDGINSNNIDEYVHHLVRLKKEKLLPKVMISHDDGWAVNKNQNGMVTFSLFNNGNKVPYQTIFTHFKPALLKKGFTENDFSTLMVYNPKEAYSIKICRV